MTIVYRPGQADDSAILTKVWAESFGHVNEQHGFGDGPPSAATANPFYTFASQHAPDGFWVAVDDGQPVGFAISLIHGSLWYLSSLFIRPGHQNRGIGHQLIERALTMAQSAGATNRALVTFAYNPASISLYLRYGMYPREPLYVVSGEAASVSAHLNRQAADLSTQEAVPGTDLIRQLGDLDGHAVGVRRDLTHRYLLSRPDATCYLFWRAEALRGYAYVAKNGRVGPVAVESPTDLEAIMPVALSMAAEQDGAEQVTAVIPGSNELAMDIAREAQLRIVFPFLFMAARPFVGWASYLFHSPGLM